MRLMITTLALCIAALFGAAPATAGALQSAAVASSVAAKAVPGEPAVQTVRHRRYGFSYGYGYGAPYYGYAYSYRPRYYYQPYAYYYPSPRYYGDYYAPRYHYKRKHRHHTHPPIRAKAPGAEIQHSSFRVRTMCWAPSGSRQWS